MVHGDAMLAPTEPVSKARRRSLQPSQAGHHPKIMESSVRAIGRTIDRRDWRKILPFKTTA
jgi:hypothetical protein